jgi:Ca-activated chloride channel family protein
MIDQKPTFNIRKVVSNLMLLEAIFGVFTFSLFTLIGFFNEDLKISSIHFLKPFNLFLFVLLIPFTYLFVRSLMRKNQIDSHLSQFNKKGIAQVNSTWTLARFYILRSAFVFLIFAMAQPIYGKKKVKGTVKSMELVVCLDVSNSMNTMDIEQTPRIEVAKRALNALVNTLAGEKIGLCIFAGNAYVQLPLTTDYNAAKLFINDVTTDFVSNQGTNISDALSVSNGMFSKENVTKAIFVITDGENHESENKEIYSEIIENNIQVCVLGIGTSTGGTIPVNPNYLGEGYISNSVGQRVISRMNPSFVKQIASQTNGVAMITSEAYPDLQTLLTQINQMKRTKLRDLEFDIEETRYQLPLFVSLICFVIWLFMPMLNDLRSKK